MMRGLVAACVAACASAVCNPTGFDPANRGLNLSRWTVTSDRDVDRARAAREFGRYAFSISDGVDIFMAQFAMTEGYPFSQPIDPEKYARLHRDVRLRAGDVTVASHPKTGTTWVEQIVLLLHHGAAAAHRLDPASRNTYDHTKADAIGCWWLEPRLAGARAGRRKTAASLDDFARVAGPRVLKSHAPFELVVGSRTSPAWDAVAAGGDRGAVARFALDALRETGSKVIYVTRNPKDAAVSGAETDRRFGSDRQTLKLVSLAQNEVFSARSLRPSAHLGVQDLRRSGADPSRRIRSNSTMLNVS